MTRHTLLALTTVFVLGVSGAVPGVQGKRIWKLREFSVRVVKYFAI